jgi:hypothetical protein
MGLIHILSWWVALIVFLGAQSASAYFVNNHTYPGLPKAAEQMPGFSSNLGKHLLDMRLEKDSCASLLSISSHVLQNSKTTVSLVRRSFDTPNLKSDNAMCGPTCLAIILGSYFSDYDRQIEVLIAALELLRARNANNFNFKIAQKGMTFAELQKLTQLAINKLNQKLKIEIVASADVRALDRISVTPETLNRLGSPNVVAIAMVKKARYEVFGKFNALFGRPRNPDDPWPSYEEVTKLDTGLFEQRFSPRGYSGHYVVIRNVTRSSNGFYELEILDPEVKSPYILRASIEPSRYGVDILRLHDQRYLPHVSYGDWPSDKTQSDPNYLIYGIGLAITDLILVEQTN